MPTAAEPSAAPDFLPALTGSFSSPAAGNPTGVMVEAAYRHHGIHARYVNCEVAAGQVTSAVAGAWAMGWIGFNCSLPHKVAVLENLVGLSESAEIIGAVNCAVRADNGFIGHNTDGKGFLTSLQTVADPGGASIVLYGAGGAARAVAVELALAGAAEIVVVNRDRGRGQELVDLIDRRTPARARLEQWQPAHPVPAAADVVVNATSVGLFPDVGARPDLDYATLRAGQVVADVIFNPVSTRLLRAAEEAGCVPLDGRGMLVNQAVEGIRLWTGVEVDAGVMSGVLDRALR
ncbi:MAG: shikimate dehydrogenase [Nocardioides sp.]